ncbi:MAG: AAA family ATPase [Chloroflexi bacterium]|nr:AAA family ATPase [Chloroflexota bacterium]MCI0648100.1 AAA family ATPase [Chloroflexota bacterium]
MTTLDRIEIAGFKSIKEMDIELRPLNILVGANGAGKSNFISVFNLVSQIVARRLQSFVAQSGGANALLHYGSKITDSIYVQLHFGQNGYIFKLAPTVEDRLFFAEETVWFHDHTLYERPYDELLGVGNEETELVDDFGRGKTRIGSYVLQALKSWRVYHFHDTSDTAKVKLTGDINDNASLRVDAGNLAAFLYRIQETEPVYYDRIVQTIRLVAPFFDNFLLRPDPLNPNKIRLEWREVGSDSPFGAYVLSDGTLRFICLATLLLQPDETLPATILIDEPELGLHPYAITLLASLLRSVSTKRQVIVTTQSVTLVNQFAPEDIIIVDREEGRSLFTRQSLPQLQDWLDEYSLGELWEKNVIGGRP